MNFDFMNLPKSDYGLIKNFFFETDYKLEGGVYEKSNHT